MKKIHFAIWLISAVCFAFLNFLFVNRFNNTIFIVSGYDSFLIGTVSDFIHNLHPTVRHALLDVFMLPLAVIKTLLAPFGNFTSVLLAIMICTCSSTTFLYMYRICRELLGLSLFDAICVDILYFSIGYVMLSSFVPESYPLSMMLQVVSLYEFGRCKVLGSTISMSKRIWLYLIATGITTTNGIKILIMDYCRVRDVKTFFPYAVRASILVGFICGSVYMAERTVSKHVIKPQSIPSIVMNAETAGSSYDNKKEVKSVNNSTPGFLCFFNFDIPFVRSVTDNFLGETFVLHENHLLEDPSKNRPLFVEYASPWSRVLQVCILLLFAAGIIVGWRGSILRMALATFSVELILHLVMRWALDEVYIMGPHWLFVVPVAVASLYKLSHSVVVRLCVISITLLLLAHNASLIIGYLS